MKQEWKIIDDEEIPRMKRIETISGDIVCGWCAPIAWGLLGELVAAHNIQIRPKKQTKNENRN